MKNLLLIALMFSGFSVISQIEVSQKTTDFGDITQESTRIVDLVITNNGNKKTFILRSDFGPEFKFLYSSSSKIIEPDSSITLRVRYDPRKQGTFKVKSSLWFSTEEKPLVLIFKGSVDYLANSYNTPCPDFSQTASVRTDSNDLIMTVVNGKTKEKIKAARIRIIEQGILQKTVTTNKKGQKTFSNIPISYYYFVVDANGYFDADTALYINRMSNRLTIELEPKQKEQIVIVSEEVVEEIVVVEEQNDLEVETDDVVVFSAEEEDETPPVVITSDDFLENKYAKNNIVFLIDVSQSMNQKGKLDLLKNSMYALVDILREGDDITIITYASNPQILLPTTSGLDKEKTKEIIKSLEAKGATSGSKAFKMAYEQVLDNLIVDGNNQIIVATDGAFKEEDNPKIMKMVKKNQKNNIITTVVGIKSNIKTSEKLKDISKAGKGTFIFIENFDSSRDVLIEEIKKQSKI